MAATPLRLLQDILLASEQAQPDKIALVVEGSPYTYAEFLSAARALAGTFQEQGLRRGDRVAIYADNTFPCAVSIFATLMAGGVFLVINPQTKTDKLAYILRDSGARMLVTDGHLAGAFGPALAQAESLQAIVCSGKSFDSSTELPILAFDDACSEPAPVLQPVKSISLDLAALIYTSGSTGNPKGVMMTHGSMLFTTQSLAEYIRLSAEDRILNVLPMAFDYGLYQLFMSVYIGGTLVLERSFTYPAQILARVREQAVTVFPGVPTIYAMLISQHDRNGLELPSIRRVTNTAAALPADWTPKLQQIFPQALIFKMYGLTECKRVSYLEPELLHEKADSVGKAIPGTEAYVLKEDGSPAKPGEVGILHVRGAHVMLGYWNLPDRSAEMLKPGKFPGERVLCTQDHFKTDADGFLYFVGRTDDIIKTRGEKVSPVEVENVLHGFDGVREAAVIGIPDELLGQALRAYVALEEGCELNERELKKMCMARLENFMVPKEFVFLSELPKTATGKIRKKGLLELNPAEDAPGNS